MFRESGVVHSFKMVDPVLFVFESHVEKSSDIKFHENPSSGSRVVPCGQKDGETDRHDAANSRFPQFCEHA